MKWADNFSHLNSFMSLYVSISVKRFFFKSENNFFWIKDNSDIKSIQTTLVKFLD